MSTCQLCEQHDDTGGYLCVGCTKATRVRLECLPALYDGLLPFLAPSAAISQGRSGSGGPAPLPVSVDVLDLRGPGGMVGVAEDWLTAILRERSMGQRARAGSADTRLRVAVSGLLANLAWVAVSWSEAGTFAAEIRELARSVSSIIRPSSATERGTRIGQCPAMYETGEICGAVLRLGPGERVVTCEWCQCSYPPATWAGLKVLIDEDARAGSAA